MGLFFLNLAYFNGWAAGSCLGRCFEASDSAWNSADDVDLTIFFD